VHALGHRGDHDVVDRAAEPRADLPEATERRLGHREPSVRADPDVEGSLGPPAHTRDRPGAGERFGDDLDGAGGRVHRGTQGLERIAHRLLEGAGDQVARPGHGLGRPRLGLAAWSAGLEVEQHRPDRHAGDPVGHRMMQLQQDRGAALLHALEDVQLP
jgi:hypothetical protein